MALSRSLKIGTRASKLALAQAGLVRTALGKDCSTQIVPITTTGDKMLDRPLVEEGGKGLFVKEIEDALLSGAIDVAVHSAKDLPAFLPKGLILAACLLREDARDCLISRGGIKLAGLPQGASVGTSSPRRAALVKRARPDLKIIPIRGNVETRLAKIERGEADATLLALAGLKRINLEKAASEILGLEDFPPAVGQGTLVLEIRESDARTQNILARINHQTTFTALIVERAFLSLLEGSCRTPIAGYAEIANGQVSFYGLILQPNGQAYFETRGTGAADDAEKIGREAALELKRRAPHDFFEAA